MTGDARELQKRRAGEAAVSEIASGMRVGLGTGSTVRFFIEALAASGHAPLCVATSDRSEELATRLGLRVVPLDEAGELDVTVDGADEVDPRWNLIKGGGGAHVREKIVAASSRRFVVVTDATKIVPHLGAFPLPVEVIPFAPDTVSRRLVALGAREVTRREGSSDNGNPILDAHFGTIAEPEELAARLSAIPGVVDHGIFPGPMVSRVIVGEGDGARDLSPSASTD